MTVSFKTTITSQKMFYVMFSDNIVRYISYLQKKTNTASRVLRFSTNNDFVEYRIFFNRILSYYFNFE